MQLKKTNNLNITDSDNFIIASLFFTYFIVLGSYSFKLLSCNIQYYLYNNTILNHIIIFFSIFLFTYILKWYNYTPNYYDDINSKNDSNLKIINPESDKFLMKSFIFSIFIYILFIFMLKSHHEYFLFNLILIILIYILQIYIKSKYFIFNNHLNNDFIFTKKIYNNFVTEYGEENKFHIQLFFALMLIKYILIIILIYFVIYGLYKNISTKKKIYKKNFDYYLFIFGKKKCNKKNFKF